MTVLWSAVIRGELASAKNSRDLVPRKSKGGKPYMASIKSAKAQAWVAGAVPQMRKPREPIAAPVVLTATCFYGSQRPDLDEALLMDALQLGRVIVNDRQIRTKHVYWGLDPANPRVEVALSPWEAA